MIEVEKKFRLTPEQSKRLTDDTIFVGEKRITDVYFDDNTYSLTRGDMWLRKRDGQFELKRPAGANSEGIFVYDELEDDNSICQALQIPENELNEEILRKAGYAAFCVCNTTRTKYKDKAKMFGLDLDKAQFENFSYELAEIEIMAEDQSGIADAEKTIAQVALRYGLSDKKVRGKIIEYIARERPDHFTALKEAWDDPNL